MPQSLLPLTLLLLAANLLRSDNYAYRLHILYFSPLLNQLQSTSCPSAELRQLKAFRDIYQPSGQVFSFLLTQPVG